MFDNSIYDFICIHLKKYCYIERSLGEVTEWKQEGEE